MTRRLWRLEPLDPEAVHLAPELVVPVAIGSGLAVGIASGYLARRTSERDSFSER